MLNHSQDDNGGCSWYLVSVAKLYPISTENIDELQKWINLLKQGLLKLLNQRWKGRWAEDKNSLLLQKVHVVACHFITRVCLDDRKSDLHLMLQECGSHPNHHSRVDGATKHFTANITVHFEGGPLMLRVIKYCPLSHTVWEVLTLFRTLGASRALEGGRDT